MNCLLKDPAHSDCASWQDTFRGRDVVVVSPQYWGDMWVSKHWIASELSKCARVLFIEPPLWVGGMVRRPLQSRWHLPRLLRPVRKVNDSLTVFTPRLLPHGIAEKFGPIPQQARRVLDQLGFRDSIVLNFDVDWRLVRALQGDVAIYYCVDPVLSATGNEDEAITCRDSDLVYAISDAYKIQLSQYKDPQLVHVIPHGYDFTSARVVAEDTNSPKPDEFAEIQGPLVGFAGSIHDSYIDIDRLERIAHARPSYNFVLIGPFENNPIGPNLSADGRRRIERLSNVHLLGPRHFKELPRYIKWFDACLVMINIKDFNDSKKTNKRTLFKWLLYLSQGKPVIAPRMAEATQFDDLVYLAGSDDEYLGLLDLALNEDGSKCAARIDYAKDHSFERTLDRLAGPLHEFFTRRDETNENDLPLAN